MSSKVETKKTKKVNPWLTHVKQFREKNPEMPYKEVLQKAKLTYTPIKKAEKKVVKKAEEKTEENPKEEEKPKKKTRKPRKKKFVAD